MSRPPQELAETRTSTMGLFNGERHWSDGRVVIIRPDAPGKHFDPADSYVLRTDPERLTAELALDSLYDEVRSRTGKPDWYTHLEELPEL